MAEKEIAELIDKVSQYTNGRERDCPPLLVEQLFLLFKGYYESLSLIRRIQNYPISLQCLAFVGGEGIILKCLSEKKMPLCIKIANFSEQKTIPKKVEFYDINKYTKVIPRHIKSERFRLGCLLQKDVKALVEENNISIFSVPEIYHPFNDDDEKKNIPIPVPALHVVMEWIESPNVLTWIKIKKNQVYSMELFSTLLGSILFLHKRGILHRDLKPDNILMGHSNKELCIVDWTLSKEIGDRKLTVPGTMGGTPGFAPAKFILDKDFALANRLDDIYYLGMTFWSFITLDKLVLLEAEDYTEDKINRYIKFLSGLLSDTAAAEIFLKATAMKEEERYQSIEDFQKSIEEYIEKIKVQRFNPARFKIPKSITIEPESIIIDDDVPWEDYVTNQKYRNMVKTYFDFLQEKENL
jgi:serine/threonine protein kinase